MKPIYLDYNATTPLDPEVVAEMQPYLTEFFGNPSSSHVYGQATRKAIELARQRVSRMLECSSEEVVFTSGGTEANNFALIGAARSRRALGNHIITSSVEHPAITEVCRFLEKEGFDITWLPVDEFGLVSGDHVKNAITDKTILISVMHANNEVGTIEPIKEISRIAHESGILVHSDCAQSVGKIPVTTAALEADLVSIAGHKLYAPKGVGALFIKSGVQLEKLMFGADHEMNKRPGTENVLEIVGLGKACELVSENLETYSEHMLTMKNRFEKGLTNLPHEIVINGHPEKRLPNTCSAAFRDIDAQEILSNMPGIAASAGAACHSDGVTVSSVLTAMQVPLHFARGTIRFSLGRTTTEDDIDNSLQEIQKALEKI